MKYFDCLKYCTYPNVLSHYYILVHCQHSYYIQILFLSSTSRKYTMDRSIMNVVPYRKINLNLISVQVKICFQLKKKKKKKIEISNPSMKIYTAGSQQKCHNEAIVMSAHKIMVSRNNKQDIFGITLLSRIIILTHLQIRHFFFQPKKYWYFSCFSRKRYVVGTH